VCGVYVCVVCVYVYVCGVFMLCVCVCGCVCGVFVWCVCGVCLCGVCVCVIHMGEKRNAYGILMGKLGRLRFRCEYNIKMGIADWINVSKDCDKWRAVVNTVMNFRVS